MARINVKRGRPGWTIDVHSQAPGAHLPRRRWRILHSLKPRDGDAAPVPAWVDTPEDFVRWLSDSLHPADLYHYFRELEVIAKSSCDLELLRFAHKYLFGGIEEIREQS